MDREREKEKTLFLASWGTTEGKKNLIYDKTRTRDLQGPMKNKWPNGRIDIFYIVF